MKIDKPAPEDIRAVAAAMRDSDFAELGALSFAETRDDMADVMVTRLAGRNDVMAGWLGETPVCIGATFEMRPNVSSLLFFATDQFSRIGLPITRFIVRQLFPRLRAAGVHRIETVTAEANTAGRAWIETLGLRPETGPLLGYGRGGETFIQYSWVR